MNAEDSQSSVTAAKLPMSSVPEMLFYGVQVFVTFKGKSHSMYVMATLHVLCV